MELTGKAWRRLEVDGTSSGERWGCGCGERHTTRDTSGDALMKYLEQS